MSNHGRVRRSMRGRGTWPGRVLKKWTNHGYPCVKLGGIENAYVHRLVLEAFASPVPEWAECANHRNGIKDDNRLENLEWSTYKANLDHAFANRLNDHRGEKNAPAKLTEEEALEIYERAHSGEEKQADIAADYGVSETSVSSIKRRITWAHVLPKGKAP